MSSNPTSSKSSCKTTETLPEQVSISYGAIQIFVFVIISIWCIKTVKKHEKWSKGGIIKRAKIYLEEVYQKRKMIIPLLSVKRNNLFDK